ncbi:hypothetical protein GCM10009096_15240 [Parasphingorhabdus litoris]|uniref:Uncharacterized protein n=1 Tax=Parasphingorhabdus litoris TaxID=394733 RepID=A0ABN1AET7_9SPHN|nr:hypothetical protein [Parasphingorhabdus litoris]
MKRSRPKSILWFERFFFLSLGIELLNEYMTWPVMLEEIHWESSSYMMLWSAIIALSLLLWYFLAIKAKAWARWVQIILAGMGAIFLLIEIGSILAPAIEDGNPTHVVWDNMIWPETFTFLYVLVVVTNLVATYFLFRPDAVKWFDDKQIAIDTVFD